MPPSRCRDGWPWADRAPGGTPALRL